MGRNRVVRREVEREEIEVEPEDSITLEEEYVPAPGLEPASSRAPLVRVTQMIWFLFGVLEALLGLRFVLKLIAANPDAGFTRFVYSVTDVFMAPFAGLTAEPSAGGMVLEIPVLVAMLAYGLLAWALVRLAWILMDRWAGL